MINDSIVKTRRVGMIKVIVSDLDGTLLPKGCQQLEPEMITLIKELINKYHILFVAASGRQYSNIRRMFEPIQDQIAYICENGSIVVYQGEVLYKKCISKELSKEVIQAIWKKASAEILLSGEDISYIKPKSDYFYNLIKNVMKNNVVVVDNILSVEDEFLKISLYERNKIGDSIYDWQKRFADQLTVVTSSPKWLDFTPKFSNKGKALEALLRKLEISPKNCMAFGDEFNDIEMLNYVGYGFAMNYSREEVKNSCKYQTDQVESILKLLYYDKKKFYDMLH